MAQQNRLGTHATTVSGPRPLGIRVTYHSTIVVEVGSRGIQLNSGGWRTATTKTRMNQASAQFGLGFKVYQQDGDWFVTTSTGTQPFFDGMVL